ncbi:DUF4276 family protein [Streptomyces albidoflavus]|uniref:DUF4276 family protein n=1 Tax=Streptomyces albidoflavus TaxID=1886 RepID=UPI0033D23868
MTLRILFTGEGTSDNGLVPHIEMVAAEVGVSAAVTAPDFGRLDTRNCHSVAEKLKAARWMGDHYDLVIVHRDADRAGRKERCDEIAQAVLDEWPGCPHIAVIPVRALEAWLLVDEPGIRRVAENPNGRQRLSLPKAAEVERIADPKKLLQETLATASGLSGRRLTTFRKRFPRHRHKLLQALDSKGAVSTLPSWQMFIRDLNRAIGQC